MKTTLLPPEMTAKTDQLCRLAPVIPVLTINQLKDAIPIAEALVAGGLPVLEVTLRTPHALDAIDAIARAVPDAHVGAGTIINPADFKRAVNSGSSFIVSPGITAELLDYGTTSDTPYLPGIQTVSELMTGIQWGYQRFKFFPAEIAGGSATLKAFAGPFGNIRFCPTGGIRAHSASEYLALANVMCVGGTWLTPADSVAKQDWQAITRLAQQAVNLTADTAQ
ncbi:bifunctional 4-hydroxy-2-oxoglutarate aldolase/2-dehydro-3-deoxy-phosphogluconate aldolase [Amphritea sp. 1_MG-2023]|uniref:bifunctional 4-hydroxy-2-oxoglutarate aldolase/2-dehydro-3-deoxy-phosphogluconate aldolase n=1 Tax=Amphritea sp. 1_MG-2023 TaxID=3062670 RepID=UPI0026E43CB6|nr:bifunctional 4-hydroxy-2-oxoglutarate aldolase/2-dehydro-3-deoxy-phosphogluconate aldolase [Amphritea sp. 1_MG-2023]MDO6563322.1 bifunctional 4-hydroxy-2-oxoglutarate aldolase/2-dehydro-3-deoxy-phosphogluconate aldolase [Amphritea sp. 1_MG-2023]